MTDDEFIERFNKLFNIHKERFHKRIDYAKVPTSLPAFKQDERYWSGWNAALDWAHRIVNGDKSAD